jgi:hypothetical protein
MTKIRIIKGGVSTSFGTLTPELGILEVDWDVEEIFRLQDIKQVIEIVSEDEIKPPTVFVVGKDRVESKKKKGK